MKSKLLFALLGIFTLVLAAGIVSAFTLTSPDVVYGQAPATYTLIGDAGINQTILLSVSPVSVTDGTNSGSVQLSAPFVQVNDSETKTFTVGLSNFENLEIGKYTSSINASNSSYEIIRTINFLRGFCSSGEQGSDIEIRDVSVNNDVGSKDDKWNLLDEITVKVKVKAVNNDVDDVFVELGLINGDGKNVADELEYENDDEEEIDLGNLDEDEKETAEFKFKVPADFDEDDYKLTIKVYSDDAGEDTLCTSLSEDFDNDVYFDVEVNKEKEDVIADDLIISPIKATSGEKVVLSFDVYNIGEEDEDKVRINIDALDLNIDEEYTLNGLDSGDGERVELEFTVPNLEDGKYRISVTTDFNYKSSTGTYRDHSDDTWTIDLEVFGGTVVTEDFVNVDAELESEAKAGEQLIITATIENTADETKTFVISAKNYDDWAELSDISERVLTLSTGESEEIELTFDVEKDAEGKKTFNLEVLSGDEVDVNEVEVDIAPKSSLFGRFKGDNYLIWAIGFVNLILIILIIVVAVKLSKR